jgi:4-amino-4-deoxy-L-arabinose transferase-like glycosyltransferase
LILPSIFFGAAFTLLAAYAAGAIVLRKLPAPPEIVLGVGTVAVSTLVFLLLLFHAGYWPVYLTLGAVAIGLLRWFHVRKPVNAISMRGLALALFAAYGIFYLVNALAPETVADGYTYHLGRPYEYVRRGTFSNHISFYNILPQGMEMLFTMAFAFGRHSAAKLVEFALFVAGVPLIFRIGQRLKARPLASLVGAVFYFTAPVIALTGTTSYNDAAVVFFTLAAFYLLLVWRDTGDDRYLFPAGLLAGFCYAIKFPGIFTALGAVLFVLAVKPRKAAILAAGAAVSIAPWMIRSTVLTHDPVAPLMSGIFQNAWFHAATEADLASGLRSLHDIKVAQVPWELAFGDRLGGIFGPLLFLLPAALLGLRKPGVRLCLAAAAILAIPWFSNSGARFLMPSLTFAAIGLGMALPRPLAWAAIALQAVACLPPVLDSWLPVYQFRLHEFPWRAALRIEPEDQYLTRHIGEYGIARMIERNTPPGARIFSLLPVADAYQSRDVMVSWTSAEGDRMTDALRYAALYPNDWFFDWRASWPLQSLKGLRFRMPAGFNSEWDIAEVHLFSGDEPIFNSPQWSLRAWPNRWEAPLAFDHLNLTRWRTWQPIRAGMFFEVDLDRPQRLSGAVLESHTPIHQLILEFYGQDPKGKWSRLTKFSDAVRRPPQDMRLEAAMALRRAGYGYVLVPTGSDGWSALGKRMKDEALEWGMEKVADVGSCVLLRVR